MTNTAPLPQDALEHLRLDGTELIRMLANADLGMSVPTCPGWDLADLAFHIAEVWDFWANVVSLQITDRSQLRDRAPLGRSTDRKETIDVAFAAHVGVCDALHSADTGALVWTWTGANRPVTWVARRMMHETMVHLGDAAATLGYDIAFDPAAAADGIDEWLTWFAAETRAEGEMKVGGTVHLHCTDAELPHGAGEWFVSSMKEPQATFTREHRKGDAAVRGRAQDIFMWLWRRSDDVEVLGDTVVARRFRAFTDLT